MFETGLDIHHDMVLNVIVKMTEFSKIKAGNMSIEFQSSDSHVIRIGEFFRNNLIILIIGYNFALIVSITEIIIFIIIINLFNRVLHHLGTGTI